MLIHIFLISFFITLKSIASDSCAGSDIRLDLPPNSMSHMPVLDQDGTGLCYSYVATQLVDAYRFSHGDRNLDHRTSPVAAAVIQADSPLQEGKYSLAIKSTGKQLRDAIYDPYGKYVTGVAAGVPEIISSIKRSGSCSHDTISNFISADGQGISDKLLSIFDEHQAYLKETWFFQRNDKFVKEKIQCELNRSSLRSSLDITADVILKALKENNPLKYLKEVIAKACVNRNISVNIPKLWNVKSPKSFDGTKQTQRMINTLLNAQNPQPIGVGFCSQALSSDSWTLNLQTMAEKSWANEKCAGHAALIVGKRMLNGRCEYLVRNSWGTSCMKYKKNYTEQTPRILKAAAPERECIEGTGQIWIPADTLIKNTVEIWGLG